VGSQRDLGWDLQLDEVGRRIRASLRRLVCSISLGLPSPPLMTGIGKVSCTEEFPLLLLFSVLGIKLRALCMLGKDCTELEPQPYWLFLRNRRKVRVNLHLLFFKYL
jgi:hypothetical protein